MNPETPKTVSTAPDVREPESKDAVVPVWLIVILFMLLYWGALYFDQHGGWFSAKVYAPFKSAGELDTYQISGPMDPISMGLKVYNKPTCVTCHQATGQGTPGTFPPLVKSDWVNEPEPGRIIRAVLMGLQGPITVNGQSFNNAMIPFGGDPPAGLTDEEIAGVLTYIRQNKEWGNNAPAVTPARVKAVREALKAQRRTTAFTADELMKINPAD